MNANELADKLEKCCLVTWGECNHDDYDTDIWTKMKSATMLRQQQAEIEALKQIIDANNLSQNIGQFVKPANKPVAWLINGKLFEEYFRTSELDKIIPLYTHPVKDLEDIDINITWNENSMRDFGKDELAFARAILRKASEK